MCILRPSSGRRRREQAGFGDAVLSNKSWEGECIAIIWAETIGSAGWADGPDAAAAVEPGSASPLLPVRK